MNGFYKKSIKNALRGIGCPVAHLLYKGDEETHITYYSYRREDTHYANDVPILEGCFCTVEVFGKTDDQTLVEEVRKRLAESGWYISDEDEDYDEDKDLYVTRIDINYTGVEKDGL